MGFRIDFEEFSQETDLYRIVLHIAEVSVRSPPQQVDRLFGDLFINRRFLNERKLSKFFVCDEPIINLSYLSDDLISAFLSKRTGTGYREFRGEFFIRDALTYLDGVLDALEVTLTASKLNKAKIIAQVDEDMSLGVYNVFLREVH